MRPLSRSCLVGRARNSTGSTRHMTWTRNRSRDTRHSSGTTVDMPQLEHIEAIETRLWGAADTLRANSNYASNEYFLPVMGLVFLRHAYSRYLAVKDEIEAGSAYPRRQETREVTKQDFSRKSAIFLRPEAQFDHLVALPDGEDRARAIIAAMESIEAGLRTACAVSCPRRSTRSLTTTCSASSCAR